jgi:chloride channel 7
VSLVVLVMEGTRGIEFMFGIILSVVVANWVAHHIHHDGVYESELERIGNLYFLRDEPPHRWACWCNNAHTTAIWQLLRPV